MKRGRISAAELSVVQLRPGANALRPPDDLPANVVKAFRAVVANSASGHLRPCDVPLIVSYAEATLIARKAARCALKNPDPEMLAMWDRAVRAQIALATKLRMTPHSRSHPLRTARKLRDHAPPPPWVPSLDEGDEKQGA
jgi:phage terminase small subunit